MTSEKSFVVSKQLVMKAFNAVKANGGGCGVDGESIEDFEKSLKDNLFKIWNRMCSGSYFPPPVKAVPIPKKSGGVRILGVPTVADRVAQMIVKMVFEPKVEPFFLEDSYGYRPGKSALDAVGVTRRRCWRYAWVLEWDIKGLFDEIPHELLLKAVKAHTDSKMETLYIERWLQASMQMPDGTLVPRSKGTPQGGVVSPCLANLFLHYAFDFWMKRTFPKLPWCRYADDGVIHCNTEREALAVKAALSARLAECGLALHPEKTKIVYCQGEQRQNVYPNTSFDFLGYTFQPRLCKSKRTGRVGAVFCPAVSRTAQKAMRQTTRKWNLRNRTDLSLEGIARMYNPILRGWVHYYGRFLPRELHQVLRHFNRTLLAWAMAKYKILRGHQIRAGKFMERIARSRPSLFVHWSKGTYKSFA